MGLHCHEGVDALHDLGSGDPGDRAGVVDRRVTHLLGRPVAALVYYRYKHPINLFIWPSSAGESPAPARISARGYHLLHWSQSGMVFWAVSDLNTAEMEQFEALLRG